MSFIIITFNKYNKYISLYKNSLNSFIIYTFIFNILLSLYISSLNSIYFDIINLFIIKAINIINVINIKSVIINLEEGSRFNKRARVKNKLEISY